MSVEQPTYHIIGAGIAGLSAAVLMQKKHPKAKIVIYEAAAQPGGRAYSFNASDWEMTLDNATHVILGANKNCVKICGKNDIKQNMRFWNINKNQFEKNRWKCRSEIAEAIFNTSFADVSCRQWLTVAKQLFPFAPQAFQAGFSKGNLNEILISPLALQIADLRRGWKLTGFAEQERRITELHFGRRKICIAPQDKIISALDSYNYGIIFEANHFEYNAIINLYFHTSMQITLPGNQVMLGLVGSTAQWLFSMPGLLAVTISNAHSLTADDAELARLIWQEICQIRGREAAFMPDYKILRHKRATLKQDECNNKKRPDTAKTQWSNLQICGDWAVKNYPCCLETAILSAHRIR